MEMKIEIFKNGQKVNEIETTDEAEASEIWEETKRRARP